MLRLGDQAARERPRVLVIGIGNTYRGDDGAGLAVAEWLRTTAPPDVVVVRHEGEPISLLEEWDQVPVVYLVDAMVSGAEPGNVCRFDAADGPLTARFRPRGSHALGVADAIELGRALGRLRPACRLRHRGRLLRDRGHPVAAGTRGGRRGVGATAGRTGRGRPWGLGRLNSAEFGTRDFGP